MWRLSRLLGVKGYQLRAPLALLMSPDWSKPARVGLMQPQGKIMKYSEFDYIQAGYLFERRRAKLARFERMLAREYQEHKNKAVFLFNRGRLEARSCI